MLTMMMGDKDMFTFETHEKGITLYHYRDSADMKFSPAAMLKFADKKQIQQLHDQLKIMLEEMNG